MKENLDDANSLSIIWFDLLHLDCLLSVTISADHVDISKVGYDAYFPILD